MNQAETLELLRLMRMDLTQLQARLTDVSKAVAGFKLPDGDGEKRAERLRILREKAAQLVRDWNGEVSSLEFADQLHELEQNVGATLPTLERETLWDQLYDMSRQ